MNQVVRKMIENGAGKLKDITRKHVLLVVGLKDMNVSKTVDLPYNLVATRLYHGISIKRKVMNRIRKNNGTVFGKEW